MERVNRTIRQHSLCLVLAIGLLALLIRLAFCFVLFPRLAGPLGLAVDSDQYGPLAVNWADGKGYALHEGAEPMLFRGPAYPLLLASVYVATRSLHPGAEVAQCLIGALTCLLVYFIGRRAFSPWVGYVAALAAAFDPLLIWYSSRLAYETLLTFLLALAIYSVLPFQESRQVKHAVLMGFCFGLAALANQVVLLLPIVLCAVYLVTTGDRRVAIRQWGVVFLAVALTILPWTVRNYRVSGRLIPVHLGGITQFVKGNLEFEHYAEAPLQLVKLEGIANRAMAKLPGVDVTSYASSPSGGTQDTSEILMDEMASGVEETLTPYALAYLRNYPDRVLAKIIVQLPRFWYLSESPLKSWGLALSQGFVLVFALVGTVRVLRMRHLFGLMLIATILYFNTIYAATVAEARYSTPVVPYVLILAALGLGVILGVIRNRDVDALFEDQPPERAP
jgi:4-amino-4-deoxy-L-arabinose transferase-like glycosyltransferase